MHVDYVTIPGATLEKIFHAFKIEYSYHTRPMDVYIVGQAIIFPIYNVFQFKSKYMTNFTCAYSGSTQGFFHDYEQSSIYSLY